MKVVIIGKGQVGLSLCSALRKGGALCSAFSYRTGFPKTVGTADVILLCVRDGQIPSAVQSLLSVKLPKEIVIAHVAGALGPDVLAPLRPKCSGVAQLHPYCSILSIGRKISFQRVPFLLTGDKTALKKLRSLLKLLGGQPVSVSSVERTRYHLSAALLANGTVALVHVADKLLAEAGIPDGARPKLLLSLLDSVRQNIAQIGHLRALTGPVRRGDIETIRRHLAILAGAQGAVVPLYRGLVAAQLEQVRELGEVSPSRLRAIKALISKR